MWPTSKDGGHRLWPYSMDNGIPQICDAVADGNCTKASLAPRRVPMH